MTFELKSRKVSLFHKAEVNKYLHQSAKSDKRQTLLYHKQTRYPYRTQNTEGHIFQVDPPLSYTN